VVYVTLTVINFSLPAVILFFWLYLNLTLAGFPPNRGEPQVKVNKICRVRGPMIGHLGGTKSSPPQVVRLAQSRARRLPVQSGGDPGQGHQDLQGA
jgi:hypothetical protein